MHPERLLSHQLHNAFHTGLLLLGMAGLMATLGWLLWGAAGVLVAVALALLFPAFAPPMSNRWILRLYRAEPLTSSQAPQLFHITRELARRAGLRAMPRLYYIPSRVMNAFAVGSADQAGIGLTDGLLRQLDARELANVLGHEVGHIRNGDLRVMALADFISRVTSHFSLIGQFLLLFTLPMVLMGTAPTSRFLPIAILVVAPTLSTLLQLALSRTREFAADLEAVRLTGDPEGLARALLKMERYQQSWLERVFLPGRRNPGPSYLRTHPGTEDRLARLQSLVDRSPDSHRPLTEAQLGPGLFVLEPRSLRHPRWRVGGLWF